MHFARVLCAYKFGEVELGILKPPDLPELRIPSRPEQANMI